MHFPPFELYHLGDDPAEQRNLAAERPEVVETLRKRIERHAAKRLKATGLPDPILTQSITLRKIGELKTAVPEDQRLR